MEIECYAKKRAFDADGMSVDLLMKGIWNGEVFSSFDRKGLETRIYKKDWLFTLKPLDQ